MSCWSSHPSTEALWASLWDRPRKHLKTKEALTNAVGQYINVSLYKAIDKIKIFQGDLVAFDGETLTIDYLDKTRHKTVEIPYQTVAKARLAVKL